ncbi:hypothetical protein ASPZODRAFT_61396 [Penicilliopsis zonata CBS 506.65]|uniref:EamA domain-containing protein n=1 Tax=Penicilliopsis zonata CBS 506.65 TaxID=1073090 RepID=A0A1L9SP92_9EURO|nr:hypothetical protein ASPZODRAFT_61396 [Penicilliopsis zonata CBS 506.65]OJJ48923.1 hypothetical protein ASPZODRAFT_61396 [Penicilliopsis zonata CBS 506.65]
MENSQAVAAGLLTAVLSLPSVVASPVVNHRMAMSTLAPGYDDGGGGGDGGLHEWSSLIGIVTALVGNVFISLALNIQRYAHIQIEREYEREKLRAGGWRRGTRAASHREGDLQHSYGSLPESQRGRMAGSPIERYRDESPESPDSPLPYAQRYRDHHDGHYDDDEYHGEDDDHEGLQHSFVSNQTLHLGDKQSGQPGHRKSYLRSPYWWSGIVLMCLGEAGNFMAYGFAPASIVSPLGVVALISNCVIAPIMLKEKFRKRDFWGVLVSIAGAVVVVLSAKSSEEKIGPHEIWTMITRWEFELYVGLTAALICGLMWTSAKYGPRSILIDVGLVALFGGYTALSTKGISSLLSFTLWHVITFPVTYLLVFILVSSALMQIHYINRALQRFDSTQVIPTQFVLFTLSVIIGSAVLYRDFESFTLERASKFIGGCLMTFLGVYFITSGRVHADDASSLSIDDEEGSIGLLGAERYRDRVDISPPGQPADQVTKPAHKEHEPDRSLQSPSGSLLSHGIDDLDDDQSTPRGVLSPSSPGGSLAADSLVEATSPETPSPFQSNSLITNPWAETPTPLFQATTSEPHIQHLDTPPVETTASQTPPLSTVTLRFPVAPGIGDSLLPSNSRPTDATAPVGIETTLVAVDRSHNHHRTLSVPQTPPAAGLRNSIAMRFSPGPLLPALSGGFSAVVAETLRRGEASPVKERKHKRKDSRRKRSNSLAVDGLLRDHSHPDGDVRETEDEAETSVDDASHARAQLATARLRSTGDISTATAPATPPMKPYGSLKRTNDNNNNTGAKTSADEGTLTRLRSLSDSLNGGLAWLGGSLRRPPYSRQRQSVTQNQSEREGTNTTGPDERGGRENGENEPEQT